MFFFFNDTATTEIYTLSLHDALPISSMRSTISSRLVPSLFGPIWAAATFIPRTSIPRTSRGIDVRGIKVAAAQMGPNNRSEEHTSELQSRLHLVCRLLLEKKKTNASC